MVNLELYRVFYTVAKCGSLTKAAEELFISQPAVSQAIKQLEAQLGGKLFNRTQKGMELSETGGKQIYPIQETKKELLKELPNLNIVYLRNGFFDNCEEVEIINELGKLQPDILLAGLGFPKQEKFIESFKNISKRDGQS